MEEFDKSSLYYVDSTPEGTRYSLYDTASWKNGLAFKNIDFSESGLPVIKIAELNNGISSSTAYTDKTYSQDVFLTKGDYVFSWSGNPETSIDIYKYNLPDGWLNQHIFKVTPKTEIIDKGFFFYLMKFLKPYFKKIATNKQTTGLGHVTISDLQRMSVALPPLPTQQKIAAILSSHDDKIELNNKINTNLEQQAQALFKNWFVDFEPFDGKMPEGWKVGKLSEYCNFQEGYVNPAQTHNEYFNGDVKWLRAVDINESFILNTSRTLTKCGFESAGKSSFLFKPGSIAISKSGTVGRLGIISDFMCGNRAVIGIELKDQQNLSYIHQYLKSRQTEFPDMAVGSVQKNLYVSILENLDIIIPSKEVLEKYAKICMPFYDQIKTNCVENNNLSSIRDTLLPKLMNGEIEVGIK